MSRPIEIKWKNSNELDPKRRTKLFQDLSDHLTIKLVGSDFTICSIQVNKGMLLKICQQNLNDYQWRLESELENQRGWLEDEGLKQFVMFLASGYLKTDQNHIWLYVLLACAFKSDEFLQSAMKHRIRLTSQDQEYLGIMLNTELPYLTSIRDSDDVDFMTWLIQNNPEFFKIRNLDNYKTNVLAGILEAKAKAGRLDTHELRELESIYSRRYSDQKEQMRALFKIMPWEYVSVEVVEMYRRFLSEQDCMMKLKIIAQKITQKERKLQKRKDVLNRDIAGMKTLCEEKQKRLHIIRLEKLIQQENLNNPGRYQGSPPRAVEQRPYQQDKYKPKYVEKKDQSEKGKQKQESEEEVLKRVIQQSLKDGGKKPEPPKKAKREDDDLQLAIELSKKQETKNRPAPPPVSKVPPPPPPVNRAPQKGDVVHATDSCTSRERLQFECGHTLCLDCMTLRYFNRTEAWTDMENPLSFDLATKKKVDCWQCNKVLTNKDIQGINSRRV